MSNRRAMWRKYEANSGMALDFFPILPFLLDVYLFLPGPLSRYQMVPRINSSAIKPATTTIVIIYPSFDKEMDSARKNRAKPSPNKDNTNPPNVISLRRIPCTRTAKKRPTPSFSLISAILFLCPLSTTTIMEDYELKLSHTFSSILNAMV